MLFSYKKLSFLVLLPCISYAMDNKDVIARIRGTAEANRRSIALKSIYRQTPKKNLDIKELQEPCLEETILNATKKIGSAIYANKFQIAACLPFWYKAYEGIKAQQGIKNYISTLQPYLLSKNDILYNEIIEVVTSMGKKLHNVPIFRIPGLHRGGSPGGAIGENAILLFNSLNELNKAERQFILAHEMDHIVNNDARSRTFAYIATPIISYGVLKGGSFLTGKVIDGLSSRYTSEQSSKSYQVLRSLKELSNFVGNSAIAQYLLTIFMMSHICQSQETRADDHAALLLKSVEGGLGFLAKFATNQVSLSDTSFTTLLKNAFMLFKENPLRTINALLGYREHPSAIDRMKNLINLAKKTGLPGTQGYEIFNNKIYKIV